MSKRFLALILVASLWINFVASAQTVRDYAITNIRYEFVEDESIFKLIVVVENRGTDAIQETEVIVTNLSDNNTILVRDNLAALKANASVTLEIPFTSTSFPAGTEQNIQVSVGVDNFEINGTAIAEDNLRTIIVPIPSRVASFDSPIWLAFEGDTIILFDESYERTQVILALAAAVGILLLLWLLTVILRLLFRRPPRFGTWQPPYGLMPMYDQNTLEGRRWAWQQHAQNSLLLAPPTEGNIHPIKLLMGADGNSLTNWRITALRLSQYDSYGRIARSQLIVDKKWIRRLNTILKKRHSMTEAKLQKALRPVADSMAKSFHKKLSQRNAFLPVSFDMRWEGKHGEVRIFFELYQCLQNAWYRIDQWEPMMQVLSQTMQENFTFTIHGKTTPEKMREYRERLRDDLIWLLMESFRVEAAQIYNPQEQQAARQQFDVPDTLSGMTPMFNEKETATNSV